MRTEDFKVMALMEKWMSLEGPTKIRQGGLNKKPQMVTQQLFQTNGKMFSIGIMSCWF